MRVLLARLLCLLLLASPFLQVPHAHGHALAAGSGSGEHACATADQATDNHAAAPAQGKTKAPSACASLMHCGAAMSEGAAGLVEPLRGMQPDPQVTPIRAAHPNLPPGHPPRPSAHA